MVAQALAVTFDGIEARLVEVQCAVTPGLPGLTLVGLPDKAVSEARDRVRAALSALSIALPPRKVVINLSPAHLPKEGSHFDLPIALSLLGAIGILPQDRLTQVLSLGELSLDGRLRAVSGTLPAAVTASATDLALICPADCAAEASWIRSAAIYPATELNAVIRHLTGERPIAAAPTPLSPCTAPAAARAASVPDLAPDLADVKGQERARRALEIAAAGRHPLLMTGPPGSGKSMLATRLPGLLPALPTREALELAMIRSLCREGAGGSAAAAGLSFQPPFRAPHHTASMAAMVGGGRGAKPGEISLAHNGVLFLDELPEFSRAVLETLRQPLETGEVTIARASAHVSYPARFLLVAAANPCRCGHLGDPARACARAPGCGQDYLGRISGPLMDRFDLRVEVPPVRAGALTGLSSGEATAPVAARVAEARKLQAQRFEGHARARLNADAEGRLLEEIATPEAAGQDMLNRAAESFGLSARGYHRILRLARTIADLDHAATVALPHIAEALSYRLGPAGRKG